MGRLGNEFVKSLSGLQSDSIHRSLEPASFSTILSGADRSLLYGVNNIPMTSTSYIRNRQGEVFFMIGVDRIGNNAVIDE